MAWVQHIFLSTPSARRATFPLPSFFHNIAISIHALREEGDRHHVFVLRPCLYFYPRPPRGGRLPFGHPFLAERRFLSTPSARRATGTVCRKSAHQRISIHALREEGDLTCTALFRRSARFLSTPSARRATFQVLFFALLCAISIHALREEGDVVPVVWFMLP